MKDGWSHASQHGQQDRGMAVHLLGEARSKLDQSSDRFAFTGLSLAQLQRVGKVRATSRGDQLDIDRNTHGRIPPVQPLARGASSRSHPKREKQKKKTARHGGKQAQPPAAAKLSDRPRLSQVLSSKKEASRRSLFAVVHGWTVARHQKFLLQTFRSSRTKS